MNFYQCLIWSRLRSGSFFRFSKTLKSGTFLNFTQLSYNLDDYLTQECSKTLRKASWPRGLHYFALAVYSFNFWRTDIILELLYFLFFCVLIVQFYNDVHVKMSAKCVSLCEIFTVYTFCIMIYRVAVAGTAGGKCPTKFYSVGKKFFLSKNFCQKYKCWGCNSHILLEIRGKIEFRAAEMKFWAPTSLKFAVLCRKVVTSCHPTHDVTLRCFVISK